MPNAGQPNRRVASPGSGPAVRPDLRPSPVAGYGRGVYRFLLSRRWIGFGLAVVLLAAACVWLGSWQFDRRQDQRAENELVRAHLDAQPVPLSEVASAGSALAADLEWLPVTVAGEYDVQREVVVRNQTRNGPGVEIVTPLALDDGSQVLVNRGWMPSENTTRRPTEIPAPPSGRVEITGWLRADSTATGAAVEPDGDGQVRAVSSAGMGDWIAAPLYPGFVDLRAQEPSAEEPLQARPAPDLSGGPHFFYGLQWVFFAVLGVFGFAYFAWLEVKDRRKAAAVSAAPPPDGS